MSIALKQAAEKALVVLGSATSFMSRKARDQHESVVAELRAAIQQAEAQQPDNAACKSVQRRLEVQQPATSDPAAWLDEMLTDTRETFDADGGETPQVVRDVIEYVASWVTVYSEKNHPAPSVRADVVRDAERGRFLLEWVKRYGLLQAEFGQMGVGEKSENWWLLHAPWGIDKTRPFSGHGKTPEQAIDAAMLAAKEGGAA